MNKITNPINLIVINLILILSIGIIEYYLADNTLVPVMAALVTGLFLLNVNRFQMENNQRIVEQDRKNIENKKLRRAISLTEFSPYIEECKNGYRRNFTVLNAHHEELPSRLALKQHYGLNVTITNMQIHNKNGYWYETIFEKPLSISQAIRNVDFGIIAHRGFFISVDRDKDGGVTERQKFARNQFDKLQIFIENDDEPISLSFFVLDDKLVCVEDVIKSVSSEKR